MIYLIGGPSRSGKTILAENIRKKTGAILIPLDYVEAAVSEYYPKEKRHEWRPFSEMRRKTNRDNKQLVQRFSIGQIIDAYEKQGQSLWRGIRAMINYELHRNDSIIIEGYQIQPEFVSSVVREFGNEQIRAVFLVKEDPEAILHGWRHAPSNDWLVEKSDTKTLQIYAQLTAEYGKRCADEAKKHGLMCVSTDSDFKKGIEDAKSFLLGT